MANAKKKAAKKNEPLVSNLSFEEAIRRSITTRAPKKKATNKKK